MKNSTQQTSLFNYMNPPQKQETKDSRAPKAASRTIKPHHRTNSLDEVFETLTRGLKKYCEENHFRRAVIGVSGGVDSALVLLIAAEALDAENVTAMLMPELSVTKQENIDHAKTLCQFLGVNCFYQPINNFMADFSLLPWKPNQRAHMNTKARVRMTLLYNYANAENALVLGTSNKSELMLGYGTKYGDLAADIEVIGDLYKTEVIKLAEHIGLPLEIVHKTPTAELAPDQTDEGDLGASYENLDKVLMKLDLGIDGCLQHGLPMSLVESVFRRVEQNRHKLNPPFAIKAA